MPEPRQFLGSCVGFGGLDGVVFWGVPGQPCNGIPAWGTYQPSTEVDRICSCVGQGGGPAGVTMWGPEGSLCAGISGWGTYDQACREASETTVCHGSGQGNVLLLQHLYGPAGAPTGGFSGWGVYDQQCTAPVP